MIDLLETSGKMVSTGIAAKFGYGFDTAVSIGQQVAGELLTISDDQIWVSVSTVWMQTSGWLPSVRSIVP